MLPRLFVLSSAIVCPPLEIIERDAWPRNKQINNKPHACSAWKYIIGCRFSNIFNMPRSPYVESMVD